VDSLLLLKALVMGVVEGLTEFLPVSSTGHLILAGELLRFTGEKSDVFKFLGVLRGLASDRAAQRFVLNLAIAFLPAAVLGLAFNKLIKTYLFHGVPVALAFIVGGVIILWVERHTSRAQRGARVESVDAMSWSDALKVGIAQAFALIPGTSRSGATIIGGMIFGLSRRAATEFSFFLAVPTLIAAGAYDFWKHRALFDASDLDVFVVGSIAAFVSAFLCVRWLLRYIASHDFTPFAWYRIVFGLIVLGTWYAGFVNWSAS
jgi:undecaprenyl-diphosphatase